MIKGYFIWREYKNVRDVITTSGIYATNPAARCETTIFLNKINSNYSALKHINELAIIAKKLNCFISCLDTTTNSKVRLHHIEFIEKRKANTIKPITIYYK